MLFLWLLTLSFDQEVNRNSWNKTFGVRDIQRHAVKE